MPVSSRTGAFSTDSPYQVSVTRGATTCPTGITDTGSAPGNAAGESLKTLILTYPTLVPGTQAERDVLATRFAAGARSEVAGKGPRPLRRARANVSLRNQAATNAACPFAKNLLAQAIKDVVDSYRANNPGLRYVTIVGGDNVIPFFRSPDESLLGQESGYFPPVGSTTASSRASASTTS